MFIFDDKHLLMMIIVSFLKQGTTNLWSFTAFSHVDIVEDYITQPIGHQLDNDTVCVLLCNFLLYI